MEAAARRRLSSGLIIVASAGGLCGCRQTG
jgi:hypothetical protein